MMKFLTNASRQIAWSMRMQRDRAALNEMPDMLLQDMGLSRADIDFYTSRRALRTGFDSRR
jgi:uncharacterized protein YjiS (DUF1127 family)